MFFRIGLFCVIFLMLGSEAIAQSVDWSGQLRVRSEMDSRNFDPDSAPNTYTLMRSRLGADIQLDDRLSIFLQAQDSRVFGQAGTLTNESNLDLHQGYIESERILSDLVGFRVGRMELSYGNERILGAVGWHNVGRVFDGVVVDLDFGTSSLDVIAMTIRNNHDYAPIATRQATQAVTDEGSNLFGLYSETRLQDGMNFDTYLLWEQDRIRMPEESQDDYRMSRITIGGYSKGDLSDQLGYQTELAFQTGRLHDETVLAYMLTGSLEYRMSDTGLSSVELGYDHLSGTGRDSDFYGSFDPAYHTGHKFYGFMDYFINIPQNTMERGLIDLYLKTHLADVAGIDFRIWLHHFFHETSDTGGNRFLGQEIDITGTYQFDDLPLTFEGGFSVFNPTEIMEARFEGDDVAYWGYFSVLTGF